MVKGKPIIQIKKIALPTKGYFTMKKKILQSALLILWLSMLSLSFQAQAMVNEVKNIIVIGWDAADRFHTKALLEKGKLPTLAALIKEGGWLDIDIVTGATDTKAGWTQLLTGYIPEKTGVYNNGRYEPIPEGYTVFERLKKHFGPENIDTVAVIAKKDHVDNDPPFRGNFEEWKKEVMKKVEKVQEIFPFYHIGPEEAVDQEGGRIIKKDGQRVVEVPGKPWYRVSKHFDLWINGLERNEKVTERVLMELDKRKGQRLFFFIHFAQPDHLGHQFGEYSMEYDSGIRSDDQSTGVIIDKLKKLGIYEKTLVYITADHGFDRGKKTHLYAPFVFVATNDPTTVRKEGTREDLAPTILKKFGLDLSKIEPALDGYSFDMPAPVRKANPTLTEEYRHRYNYIDNKANNAKKVINFE
jgi:hypothetical protein